MIENSKRIIFKFGTNILRDEKGEVAKERIQSFIDDMCALIKQGKEVLVVTSGAVGLGAKKLSKTALGKNSLFDKQAYAAVGQPHLMRIWEEGFEKHSVVVAQVLLSEDDFSNRKKYLHLRNTLSKLSEHGVVPIINQNDAVTSLALDDVVACFSDNDKLSALVASKLDADLLVIVSDINGLYDKNPKEYPDAKHIAVVEKVTEKIEKLATGATKGGTGGMITKLQAAKIANNSGAMAAIISGKIDHVIQKTFANDPNTPSTIFLPGKTLSGKKRWIAYATNLMGKITVDKRAKEALVANHKSLLAIGVTQVEGEFSRGDVVSICDEKGLEFAHGIVNYDADEFRKIMGEHSDKIEAILGYKVSDDIITKDNLVLL